MPIATKDQIARVAEVAKCLVSAHEQRYADHAFATLNELTALALLRNEIAALEREDVYPLAGMAV